MERTGRATGIHMEILDEILAMMRSGGEIKPGEQNVLGTSCSQFEREFCPKTGSPLFAERSFELKPGNV